MTFNEEKKIRRCLESVLWCDEIVVVDSYSTDRTVDICRQFTDRIFQHAWLGYVAQRNLLREWAANPWILFLDADEEVSDSLREEIAQEFEVGPADIVGYEFPRQVYYLGRWIRHGEWYPDIKLRLFRKSHGRTEGEEPHDHVSVQGPVKRLRGPIWHYTYDDVEDHVSTLNRFSTISARAKFVQDQPFHWLDLILRPPLRFLKGYFLKHGFLDGAHGLMIAVISSFGVAMKYVKLWELEIRHRKQFREVPESFPGQTR